MSASEKLASFEKELIALDESFATYSKESELLRLEIDYLEEVIDKIKVQSYPPTTEGHFIVQKELIEDIQKKEKLLKSHQESIALLDRKIKEHKTLEADIEGFISQGSQIVDRSQTSTCPLCSHQYESFKELSQKISSNKSLSLIGASLLSDRNLREIEIANVTLELQDRRNLLINRIDKIVSNKNSQLSKVNGSLANVSKQKQKVEVDKKTISDELQSYLILFKGSSYEVYKADNEALLIKLNNDLKSIISKLEITQEKLLKEKSELTVFENKANVFEQTVKKLLSEPSYQEVNNFFKETFPGLAITVETIVNALATVEKQIEENEIKIESARERIKSLDELLKGQSKEMLEGQIELLNNSSELLQKVNVSFAQEVKTKLHIDVSRFDKVSLTKKLEDVREQAIVVINSLEIKIKTYELLVDLKKNVEPYLKYEAAKRTEKELKDTKSFLEKKVKKRLEDEKEKVASYLQHQIKTFFYEDLINDLYSRIDPHPDYKKIKFICDFKDDKPKLNVCLYKTETLGDLIIPNLYFSTAQLNILSLSIFLAKALNAKDDKGDAIDCIFIDDPIQSMDSINILSTIDLFRSLVINYNKQIILSTHDENFHSLLKKKIPPTLFNAKYMELETFGKVKLDKVDIN